MLWMNAMRMCGYKVFLITIEKRKRFNTCEKTDESG